MFQQTYSLGIDAAMKLQNWGELQNIVTEVERCSIQSIEMLTENSSHFSSYYNEDVFMFSTGILLLSLINKTDNVFQKVLYESRQRVLCKYKCEM
jgi:hypothetical protein